MRRLGLVTAAALLSLLSSCGRKGPIMAPLEHIPKTVEDLSYTQVGAELRLRWTLPTLYIDGSPLEVAALQIWKFEEELTEETGLAPPSPERMRQEAQLWADVPQSDFATLQRDAEEDPLKFQRAFEFSRSDIGGKRFGFGINVRDGRNRYSDFSSWIIMVKRVKPDDGSDLTGGDPTYFGDIFHIMFADITTLSLCHIEQRHDSRALLFGRIFIQVFLNFVCVFIF